MSEIWRRFPIQIDTILFKKIILSLCLVKKCCESDTTLTIVKFEIDYKIPQVYATSFSNNVIAIYTY